MIPRHVRIALIAAGLSFAGAFAADKPAAPVPAGIDFATSTEVHPAIWPQGASGVKRDPAIEAKVRQLLADMTVAEKVGQVIQPDIAHVTPADVRNYHLGSILNGGDSGPYGNDRAPPADWLKLADEMYAASIDVAAGRPRIPVIWGMDAVHGNTNIVGATIFPHNIGLGAMRDPDLIRKIGEITAKEVRIVGGDWTFAPTIAVVQNDRWGRTYESYSENPALVAEYATAIVEGIQGKPDDKDFLKGAHVIATAKHFLGDGGTDKGHDQGDNHYTEAAFRDLFGPPYYAAVKAGVQTVMASHNSWRGTLMHGAKGFLTDILVGRMGFDGFTVGDWNGHARVPGCNREDCPQAFNAGLDMYMAPDGWKKLYENLVYEVQTGKIAMARLDQAVARILRVKLRAGLMEAPKPSARPLAGQFALIGSAEHRAVARQAVRESLVLLKNENRVLPLKPNLNILVAGDGANDMNKQSGGWTITWQGSGNARSDFPHADTIFEGIWAAVVAAGGTATLSVDGSFTQKPDAAIVVFGEPPYAEFRGDRSDVAFQEGNKKDLALLRKLKAQGIKVVAVFLSGRPLYATEEINAADAFVAAWLPGGEGAGIADVLIAKPDGTPNVDFRGRLSFSWPRAPDQTVLDTGNEPYYPLFAYGYGLDYANPRDIGVLPVAKADVTAANVDVFVENGRAATHWSLAMSGAKEERVLLDHTPMAAPGGLLKATHADFRKQEDTLALDWNGRGKAAIAVFGEPASMAHQLQEDMALSLTLRVGQAPTKKVVVAMGSNKFGTVDVTSALKAAAGKGWVKLQVRLSCLAKTGADMSKIAVPLVVSTDGALKLDLHAARIDASAGAGCVVRTAP